MTFSSALAVGCSTLVPPNRRLKLAAPRFQGRIVFVNTRMLRRSLGALR